MGPQDGSEETYIYVNVCTSIFLVDEKWGQTAAEKTVDNQMSSLQERWHPLWCQYPLGSLLLFYFLTLLGL